MATKIFRRKSLKVGFHVTPEQKKAIEVLAVELGMDISSLMEMAVVRVYENLGDGASPRYHALASDPAIWIEMAARARERAEEERKTLRKDRRGQA